MAFLLLFCVVSLLFPLIHEVGRKGSDNLILRSTKDLSLLVITVVSDVTGILGEKSVQVVRPVGTNFLNYLSNWMKMILGMILLLIFLWIFLTLIGFSIDIIGAIFS